MGLREQIKNAGSEAEVSQLLAGGKSYGFASDRTKNSWNSTAKNRIIELSTQDSEQTAPSKTSPVKKSSKKKN
jgi:hypothetical protein